MGQELMKPTKLASADFNSIFNDDIVNRRNLMTPKSRTTIMLSRRTPRYTNFRQKAKEDDSTIVRNIETANLLIEQIGALRTVSS